MTREDFDAHCAALPATAHVVQWGGASVWKVGGKIFAICAAWGGGARGVGGDCVSFKCSDLAYEVLTQLPGIVPAPYLARARWVQLRDPGAMSEAETRAHIDAAHAIVAGKLTRAARAQLGL